jgi:hypothetical protein
MEDELQGPEGTENSDFSFDSEGVGEGFLKDVAEADRPVVQNYIENWSKSVDKKFREIHDSYKGYKDLEAKPEDIRKWKQVVDLIETNPQQVYESLKNHLGIKDPETPKLPEPGTPTGESGGENVQGSIPPEVQKKLDELEKLSRSTAEAYLNQTKAQQEAEQQKQFDSYLDDLQKKHGEYDKDWVTWKISQGIDGEAAVKEYIEKYGVPQSKGPRTPPPLTATGHVPQGTDIRKMDSKNVKELVAAMLTGDSK